MPEGYTAFLDVLGFDRRIRLQGGLGIDIERYREAVSEAVQIHDFPSDSEPEITLSSDSIVVVNRDDREVGLAAMALATSRLLYELADLHVPVRGCLSHGKFQIDDGPEGRIIYGPPISEAVRYESQQDWLGIMTAPSIIRRWTDLGEGFAHLSRVVKAGSGHRGQSPGPGLCLLHRGAIPIKSENGVGRHSTCGVLPHNGKGFEREPVLDSLNHTIRRVVEMRRMAPDPETQMRYDYSLDFLQDAKEYLDDQFEMK